MNLRSLGKFWFDQWIEQIKSWADVSTTSINPVGPEEAFETKRIASFSRPDAGAYTQLIRDINVSPALIKLLLSSREGEIIPI